MKEKRTNGNGASCKGVTDIYCKGNQFLYLKIAIIAILVGIVLRILAVFAIYNILVLYYILLAIEILAWGIGSLAFLAFIANMYKNGLKTGKKIL